MKNYCALCLLLAVFATGCASSRMYTATELPSTIHTRVSRLVLTTGDTVQFNTEGGRYVSSASADTLLYSAVVGTSAEGRIVEVRLGAIREVTVLSEKTSVAEILVVVSLVILAVGGGLQFFSGLVGY